MRGDQAATAANLQLLRQYNLAINRATYGSDLVSYYQNYLYGDLRICL